MKIFAHRGLHHGQPEKENTREAVRNAIDSSADGLEVDLQLLADGHFLLHHDDVIWSRNSTGNRQVNLINALNVTRARELDDNFLTLEDLLEWNWKDKRIVLECKSARNNMALVRRLQSGLEKSDHTATISTSDYGLLHHLILKRSFPVAPVIYEMSPLVNRFLREHNPPEVHLDESLCNAETINALDGITAGDVIAWTVNSEKRRRELERLGIKGIMTDNSELLP